LLLLSEASLHVLRRKTRGQSKTDIVTILSKVWSLICPKMKKFVIGCKALLLTFNIYTTYISNNISPFIFPFPLFILEILQNTSRNNHLKNKQSLKVFHHPGHKPLG